MDERVSHSGTTALKYVLFPLMFFGTLTAGTVNLVLAVSGSASATTLPIAALLLATDVVLSFVLGKYLLPCQHVVATEHGLRIGPPGRTAAIAYSEIAAVKDFRWSSPRYITVILKSPKPRFVFLARGHFSFGFGVHPVAVLIRNRAGL